VFVKKFPQLHIKISYDDGNILFWKYNVA